MDGEPANPAVSAPTTRRRRRRPALVCEQCRVRKIKCDRGSPCSKCARGRRSHLCIYVTDQGPVSSTRLPGIQQSHSRLTPAYLGSSRDVAPESVPLVGTVSGSEVESSIHLQSLFQRLDRLERTRAPRITTSSTEPAAPGLGNDTNFWKGRLFGPSNFINACCQFPTVLHVYEGAKSGRRGDMHSLLAKCKSLTQTIKRHDTSRDSTLLDLQGLFPSRDTSDQLLAYYLQTFESVLRIVHIPSFKAEYERFWTDPASLNIASTIRLLLVLALGSCFYRGDDQDGLRSSSTEWILTAHRWLSSPDVKHRLSIPGIQIHCLLLLARQTHAIGGDEVWVSVGGLVRSAMQMGLHRDPSNIASMSSLQAEMRRRLWATILELTVQSSIDCGQPLILSRDDYDTEPPANVDDRQLDDDTQLAPQQSSAREKFTQASTQIALVQLLPVRAAVAKYLNHFRSRPSYESTIQLNAQLSAQLRAHVAPLAPRMTPFQQHFVELLTQRFLLALHNPFAIQAKRDPTFYFSRKVCLESACTLLTPCLLAVAAPPPSASSSTSTTSSTRPSSSPAPDPSAPAAPAAQPDILFARLLCRGNGILHNAHLHAAIAISFELIAQLEASSTSTHDHHPSTTILSSPPTAADAAARRDQRALLAAYLACLRHSLRDGETGFKGYVFTACLAAQIDAMGEEAAAAGGRGSSGGGGSRVREVQETMREAEETRRVEEAVTRAWRGALEECGAWLEEAAAKKAQVARGEDGGGGGGGGLEEDGAGMSGAAWSDGSEGFDLAEFGLLDFQVDPAFDFGGAREGPQVREGVFMGADLWL